MTDAGDPWLGLERELDLWADAGNVAPFWWRDDDAVVPSDRLDRLLSLAAHQQTPLCLAVVPEPATEALQSRLQEVADVRVAVHGWGHVNHAPDGEKKAEFGPHRPLRVMTEEAAQGLQRISALFGGQAIATFVPPWNRIDTNLIAPLGEIGFTGVSGHRSRKTTASVTGVTAADIHVDIVDWGESRAFVGEEPALRTIYVQLAEAREAEIELPATGLLTHHLVMDDAAFDFTARLLEKIHAHRGATWLTPKAVFSR
jgi:hypothetical protein